ncbi:SxtJ family membrane protein [Ningiella sp. W23]|uniref:SxtJ family membrane protein n=1 Tax=Ningiella sp. W23 TaxID=3023715 RepID=UPI00375747E7
MKVIQSIMLPLAHKDDIDALQSFALTMAIAFPAVFMGILPYFFSMGIPLWPAWLSLLLIALYLLKPTALYGPYLVWMVIASVLAWFNTKLILAFAFYLLIVPMGLVMRALGKSQYHSHPYKLKQSTWIKREADKPINLKDPF